MPVLGRHQIDPKVRAQHEEQHRTKLKQALLSPHLTEEQRSKIHEQLRPPAKAVAPVQEKPLTQENPKTISLPPSAALSKLKKKELIALAEKLGLPTDGDRTQLLSRLNAKRGEV